jgi:hypothetical protein
VKKCIRMSFLRWKEVNVNYRFVIFINQNIQEKAPNVVSWATS